MVTLFTISLRALLLLAGADQTPPNQRVGRLEGSVRDEMQRPITGAQVTLGTSNRTTVTDDNGRFLFERTDTGSFEVHVRRLGYAPARVVASVRPKQVLEIVLVALPRVLEEIRVRENASGIRYSGTVVNLSREPIAQARVSAYGFAREVITDDSGHFVVPNVKRGALPIRVRKAGYKATFTSIFIAGEREDTIQLVPLPMSLSKNMAQRLSGFGKDSFDYVDLDRRARWKGPTAALISKEELAPYEGRNLCSALALLPRARLAGIREEACSEDITVLVQGSQRTVATLDEYDVQDVNYVEIFPPGTDFSKSIEMRLGSFGAGTRRQSSLRQRAPTVVIWLRDP